MKKLTIIISSLLCLGSRAQTPDTLYANENYNVAVFFPKKIRQAVVGAENYVFSYNQEHPQFFGLLRGIPGNISNLLAITDDGQVYSYILCYREELPRLVYFLEKKASLRNEVPEAIEDISSPERSTSAAGAAVDSHESIKNLQSQAALYYSIATEDRKKKQKGGISLQVNDMIYNGGEVYMIFEIANNSGIDFEPEYLRLFLSQGVKKRNASYQKLHQVPLLKYNFPEMIKHGQRKRFVYVFSKFTIGDSERTEIELREKNGNRLIKMHFKE